VATFVLALNSKPLGAHEVKWRVVKCYGDIGLSRRGGQVKAVAGEFKRLVAGALTIVKRRA